MNRFGLASLACAAMLLVSGCSDAKRILTREKRSPDEFAVYQRAPLSVPPEFALRPPAPGERRPQDQTTESEARAALSRSGGARPSPVPQASPGLQALLRDTGADQAEPNIRATIDRETSILAEEEITIADRILFWRDPPQASSKLVDPSQESRRIRENQALGDPVNKGDVPVIEQRKKAIFEGIFD